MEIPEIFTVRTHPQVSQTDIVAIAHPDNFSYKGAVEENEGDFHDYCSACRTIDDADLSDEQLEAIAVLMNRAVAYGRHLVHLENPELDRD